VKRLTAGIRQTMFINGVKLRPANGKEIKQDPQHKAAIVEPEGPFADGLAKDITVSSDVAEAEIYQANSQKAESAEQRGVRVVKREKSAMLIIVDERGIERTPAKYTGTDKVPEGRANNVEVSEVIFELLVRSDEPMMVDCFDYQKHQW